MRRSVLISSAALAMVSGLARLAQRRRQKSAERDQPSSSDDTPPGDIERTTTASGVAASNRTGRAGSLGGLAARSATRRGILKARTLGANAERRSQLNDEYALRTAADVAEQLGQMRGVMMKFGQMASFTLDALPEPARVALSSLQDSAPPMAPSLAASVVEEDLGSKPTQIFAEWDPTPVAAASIGQVHRAVTSQGDDVAVKVQYPGLEAAIEADLANTDLLYSLLGRYFSSLDTKSLVSELSDRITEELDYELEARNQATFREMFADHPWVRIPGTFERLSSRRVLTSEWVDGSRFASLAAEAPESLRQRSAEVIWRFSQHSIHRHQMFNGDPHPGNYRFHQDGTVSFLDFGMVKRWTPAEWDRLRATLVAVVVDREPDVICEAMGYSGFLDASADIDPRRLVEYVSVAYEPYFSSHFEFSPEWFAEALSRATRLGSDNSDVIKALNIPPSFLLLNRVVWGVNALMSKLGARGPFRDMLMEYVADGDPATQMGTDELEWRQRHGGAP